MRWNIKGNNKHGDTRIIKKFLWLPVWIDNEIRWLERAVIEQEYRAYMGWENIMWCND